MQHCCGTMIQEGGLYYHVWLPVGYDTHTRHLFRTMGPVRGLSPSWAVLTTNGLRAFIPIGSGALADSCHLSYRMDIKHIQGPGTFKVVDKVVDEVNSHAEL